MTKKFAVEVRYADGGDYGCEWLLVNAGNAGLAYAKAVGYLCNNEDSPFNIHFQDVEMTVDSGSTYKETTVRSEGGSSLVVHVKEINPNTEVVYLGSHME